MNHKLLKALIVVLKINYFHLLDVEVKTTGEGNVDVTGMVSDVINVQTEFGNISGSKLQGQTISLSSSEGGSVTLKNNIQGDIEINTAKNGVS